MYVNVKISTVASFCPTMFIHLADDVLNFGPLDAFSAFPFENHLQSIKRLLRKLDKLLPQVIRRIQEIEKNSLQETNKECGVAVLKKKHTNGPLLNSCNGKQFKFLSYKSWTLKTDNAAVRLQSWLISSMKCKALLIPKKVDRKLKFVVFPLKMSMENN